jgi:hypothetical protein
MRAAHYGQLDSIAWRWKVQWSGFGLTRLRTAKREEFDATWVNLPKDKPKGAPVILVRGPKTDFFALKPEGLLMPYAPSITK